MSYWILLYVAIVFEVIGTTFMKASRGFTVFFPTAMMFLFYLVAIVGLTVSLKRIEMGIAYAIWAGLGTFLIAGIGVLQFSEQLNALKVVSLLLVISGVIGLNLSGMHN